MFSELSPHCVLQVPAGRFLLLAVSGLFFIPFAPNNQTCFQKHPDFPDVLSHTYPPPHQPMIQITVC